MGSIRIAHGINGVVPENTAKPLYIIRTMGTKKTHFPIPVNVEKNQWNAKQSILNNSYVDAADCNEKILKIIGAVKGAFGKNENVDIQEIIDTIFYGEIPIQKEAAPLLIPYCKEYIVRAKDGRLLKRKTGQRMSAGYIRALGVTISRLTAFEALKGRKYTFTDITEEWGNSYLTYLRELHVNEKADKDENGKKETGLGENSICKDIKNLKTFMMQGVRDKVHANLDFKQIPAISQESDNIRLTPDEVKAILDLDLTDHPHLVKERDRFSLAYNFLLRFSDSIRVDPKFIVMVEGKPYLDMMTEKTKSRVVIPIKERNYTFLKENNYKIATANSTSNDNLKQLGWLANILEPVTITELRKGKIQTKQYRKFELITTHTTRRSAATNLYLEGADLERIRIMGGWSNLKQLQTYIRLDKLEAAKALSSMKFFE